MAENHYQLLGVAENATNAEIEAAFKSKAREVHPDKVPPGNPYLRKVASEAFKDLSEAKSVLLDSAERRKYDAKLAYMRGSGPSYAAPTTPPPPPSSPPAPASTSQQAQRYSFWKPSKTRFGAGVLAALSLGCILLLVGITAGDKTALLGLTLLCLALALLCWRHGGRPGTDAAFLGGSVFLFIFAAISFAGWLQSAPSDPRVPIATATRLTQAQATPVVPNKIPCRSPDGQPCVSTAALPQKLKMRTVSVEGVGDFEVPADWDQSKIRSYLKAYKRKYPKSFERQTPNPTDKSAPSSATASHGLSSVSMGGQSHRLDSGHPSENDPTQKATNGASEEKVGSLNDASVVNVPLPQEAGSLQSRRGSGQIDMSSLSVPERESIESACLLPKMNQGPAAYNRCLQDQLAKLATAPPRPDLSSLSGPEQQSIESACLLPKMNQGPAAYNRCLQNQMGELRTAPSRPDLSSLSGPEQQSIESACLLPKMNQGPAAYNRCLQDHLAELRTAPGRPDLSGLNVQERQSIESACLLPKMNQGPAAYNRCLVRQLELLKNSR